MLITPWLQSVKSALRRKRTRLERFSARHRSHRAAAPSPLVSHVELLEELAAYVKDSSLCQLGGTAPNPVLSTIRYFRDEYVAHIRDKRCPAGVCKALDEFSIDAEACTGCELCRKNCPTEAIAGEKKQPHTLDRSKCIKCGVCYDVCMFKAVNAAKAEKSA